jgi:hypothetical protein
MGAGQKDTVAELLKNSRTGESIAARCDYGGVERVIKARTS